jgi:HK97 family phage major capsid protein
MTAPLKFPRALAGRVHAQAPEQLFAELQSAVVDFKRVHNERLDNLESAMNGFLSRVDDGITPINGVISSVEPEYTRAFASYARKGDGIEALRQANAAGDRATIHAALSVASATDGGFLAPVEWDRKLHERQRASSPMRRLAQVQVT